MITSVPTASTRRDVRNGVKVVSADSSKSRYSSIDFSEVATPEQLERINALHTVADTLYQLIELDCPESNSTYVAISKLDDCVLYARKSIMENV